MKSVLWKLETAKRETPPKETSPKSVHNGPDWLKTRKFRHPEGSAADHVRFAVVRDPILRLRSAWRDKITAEQIAKRAVEVRDLEDEYLPTDPTFGELIDNFEAYRMISRPVRLHTTPYAWHLGNDLAFFHELFRIEALSDLEAFLSSRAGRTVDLPTKNDSSDAPERDESLNGRQIDLLLKITAPDYALLNGLYSPDAALGRLTVTS